MDRAALGRLWAMIVKELWALLRDPKGRTVLIMPPLMQLFIFTFATTLDVRNVDIGVLDQSGGAQATALVAAVEGSANFRRIIRLPSTAALRQAVDERRIVAALVIDADFDRRLAAGRPASVGLVLDGRRSNAAQLVNAYVGRIATERSLALQPRLAAAGGGSIVTNWYNPALDYIWFTLPSLIPILVSVAGLSITSQAVAREREFGTFDQLLVSPLRVHEILIGKMIPPILVGLFNATLFLIIAPLVFGVPFTGSIAMFYLSLLVYMLSLVGIGMLTSAASATQQQAFLGSFLTTTPIILLSGYAAPIDNMPDWMQLITYANPMRYFLVVSQGLFLKDMPAAAVMAQTWPMVLIACVTLGAAAWLFRARME